MTSYNIKKFDQFKRQIYLDDIYIHKKLTVDINSLTIIDLILDA